MRRYARTLVFIVILAVLAGLALGFQTIEIGNFQRGGNTLLGLDRWASTSRAASTWSIRRPSKTTPASLCSPPAIRWTGLIRTIERRVNSAGLGEPILQLLGEDRLLVQLPGIRDSAVPRGSSVKRRS